MPSCSDKMLRMVGALKQKRDCESASELGLTSGPGDPVSVLEETVPECWWPATGIGG